MHQETFYPIQQPKGQVLKTCNYHRRQRPSLGSICVSSWQLIHIPQEDAHLDFTGIIYILECCHTGVVGVTPCEKYEVVFK